MKLETQLFDKCKSRALNCSLTYQSINDYSVEIYRGYKDSYKQIFYTDGHIEKSVAIRKALKFLNEELNDSRYYITDIKRMTDEELKDENLIFCPALPVQYLDESVKLHRDELTKLRRLGHDWCIL